MQAFGRFFRRYAWFTLGFTLLTIAWGALVRATGSGEGCGDDWPRCSGRLLPESSALETWIEWSHRAISGVDWLLALGLVVWAFRLFPRGHALRKSAAWSFVFMSLEAFIGAAIVVLRMVGANGSVARALWMSAHLCNTLLLLAALALTAWWASEPRPSKGPSSSILRKLALSVAWGTLLMAATGAIAALGDTLFPARSLAEGWAQDRDAASHWSLQIRFLHPVLASAVGVVLIIAARMHLDRSEGLPDPARRSAQWALTFYFVQMGLGLANLLLLAPLWMQLIHLLAADLLWIALVLWNAALRDWLPQGHKHNETSYGEGTALATP